MKNDPIYVLIADDNEGDRVIFKAAFEEIKIKTVVKAVNDGQELMNYLSQRANVLPDILFLDLTMPLKSGLECLLEIKRIDYLKNMAVAIYSGTATDSDIEEAFVNGANVFIQKPNDIEILKNLLEEIIMINWYYQTSGLNRDNFLLNLSSETKKKVIGRRVKFNIQNE